jgi:hypothetical protein
MWLWITLVLVFAVLATGFLMRGEVKAPTKKCGSCPNADKNPTAW